MSAHAAPSAITEPPLADRPANAAQMLGVSENTVRRWIKAGVVRAVKVNGVTLVPRSELLRLLEGDGIAS